MLQLLQPFMFSQKNLDKFFTVIEEKAPKKIIQEITKSEKNDQLFIPKYKDTLFWCFYIIRNGFSEFSLVGNQFFKIEKETKIACIEYLRTKKELLKKNKWKRNYIETDLLNNAVISPTTFICLCALYDIDITIIKDHYYYIYGKKTQNIVKKSGDQYGLYNVHWALVKKELVNYWAVDSLTKPLKGVSSYKVGELKRICKQLGLKIYKREGKGVLNKKEIYNLIKTKIE